MYRGITSAGQRKIAVNVLLLDKVFHSIDLRCLKGCDLYSRLDTILLDVLGSAKIDIRL